MEKSEINLDGKKMTWLTGVKNTHVKWWHVFITSHTVERFSWKYKRRLEPEFETKISCCFFLLLLTFRHWLATYFVIRYGVPYMTYDIFAMYLSHYHRFRVKGHEDYKGHSLRTVSSFVRREFLLVLHHIALLTILLPVTLVRNGRQVRFGVVVVAAAVGVLQRWQSQVTVCFFVFF